MKIRLGKHLQFEPINKNSLIYIISILFILLLSQFTNIDFIWHMIAILAQTLVFIWFETVYYPYGIKY